MAAEAKAPSLAEEYSLPPQEAPVEKAVEDKPEETESIAVTNDETPQADETATAVEVNPETSEVQEVADKSEVEDTNPAAEETTETAEEEAEEKPEIKVSYCKRKNATIFVIIIITKHVLIYRLKQLQQISVSQQQIKQGTVSRAMLSITGTTMLFQGIEFISWFTAMKEIHWFSWFDSQKMCLFIRCVAAKGEDAPECDKFARYYRSLCPGEWVERWNEQRENGTFPGPL
uniref:Cytochrome c oxidase subunit 6b n=1 Tax=Oryza punctata TaxID=4537 RepID=A0A0E0KEJ9_ORYPU